MLYLFITHVLQYISIFIEQYLLSFLYIRLNINKCGIYNVFYVNIKGIALLQYCYHKVCFKIYKYLNNNIVICMISVKKTHNVKV